MVKCEALLGGSGKTGAVLYQDGRHLLLPLLDGDLLMRHVEVEVLSDWSKRQQCQHFQHFGRRCEESAAPVTRGKYYCKKFILN